ncbi:hypothetical protein VE25_15290 [Devosia geojensis]|uniref:Putative mRNA interferase YoeB n=1 Tax=Devosia geojensis TaxID=443610 RepID=A0A0F5FQ47_9HYPH|nr:Txe/YoeB family addiction module toxin [Devosia geojensis]KKB10948.1 hypothetical protein VE25_15290 [Devosia geojensis]
MTSSNSLTFSSRAWEEYVYWQETDRKVVRKINALLKECLRTPYTGAGKPEPLRHHFTGWWSRRIDDEHRLVYRITERGLEVAQCRYHYKKT